MRAGSRSFLVLMRMKLGDRWSFEFTVLTLLEYLVTHELTGPVTKYHLMNRVPGLPSQRRDRVSTILDLLVQKGWATTETHEDGIVGYMVSQSGKDEYRRWVSQFLAFARKVRSA